MDRAVDSDFTRDMAVKIVVDNAATLPDKAPLENMMA